MKWAKIHRPPNLNFSVMISSTEGSELRKPAFLGARTAFARIGLQHPTKLFAMLFILRPRVT